MEKIVSVAGFMLTQAIDNLDRKKSIAPMFIGYKKDSKEIKKQINDLSLEQSIPKVVSMLEDNQENVENAAILFPAELEEDGKRESVIMLMAQSYANNEYIMVSLPYKFINGKLSVASFELLDYSPFLLEELPNLEKSFINGLLSYGDAIEIWGKEE